MFKDKMKKAVLGLGYWLVAGIPWLMAEAYHSLSMWKPNKEAAVFKRVPLMLLVSLHTVGYLLWAADHFQWFLQYAHRHPGSFDERKFGILNPAIWARICVLLQHDLHGVLWMPAFGPLSLFWVWFALFGPLCLGLTLYFLRSKGAQDFDPEKLGKLRVNSDKVMGMRARSTQGKEAFLGAST